MAAAKITALAAYTTPIPTDVMAVVDVTNGVTKKIQLSALGVELKNSSTASQGAGFAADTYLVGSNITLPTGGVIVGTTYKLTFDVTKTNVGTATPIIIVRIGTLGTTGDAAICTFTFGAGTAAADTGLFELICTFRSVGSGTSAVLQGISRLTSNLTTTGISNAKKSVSNTSSGFNSTTAGIIIGASYNGGASASHTVQLVRAELML